MAGSQTDSMSSFMAYISRKGMNVTAQRLAIAESFFEYPGHHSLDDFYQHILKTDPSIGQTTVYRTLKLLCEAGLATEIQFSDNITRYEVNHPNIHHDHIICLSCGRIVEICDPRIEELQKSLAEKNGFTLSGHSHNLYGICADCRKKAHSG